MEMIFSIYAECVKKCSINFDDLVRSQIFDGFVKCSSPMYNLVRANPEE